MRVRHLLIALLLAWPAAARAEVAPAGRWIVDLGLALRVHPAHVGSSSYTPDVLPVVELQYGSRVHVSFDDGAKWIAVKDGPFSFGPVAEYRQAFNDKLPPLTAKLSDAVELGGFAEADTRIGSIEGRFRHAVNGYDGDSADLAYDVGLPVTPRFAAGLEVRSSWADRRFASRLGEPTGPGPVMPAERIQDYVTAGAQATFAYKLPRQLTLSLLLSDDQVVSRLPRRLGDARDLLGAALVISRRWGSTTTR